ncbi:MAG: M56 family metallopeptidase [Erythrobacter sp.]
MSAAVLQTLVWTGALIAFVLLARRPVARAFGPQYAYALWALPLIRLVLPPLTLPAWMAPAARGAPAVATRATLAEPIAWQGESVPASFAVAAPPPEPAESAFDVLVWLGSLPLAEALLLVWLGGAGVFLWRRFAAYFALREQLLAQAREVGSARGPLGPIRLVETPGTTAPLAFGVLDPVIALPPGFMALHDRQARDLALAHELAHHRGLDLLVNVAVQPLFALHWFSPLAHYGWLALRRDQEAACDARVIASSSAEERAAYARLIAGFAAGPSLAPNIAISAPMACPVLGEKSIVERLRSLTMPDTSPRRRLAGRALLGLGLLALPLTATISYAASENVPAAPEPPAPPAPPSPPLPPEAGEGGEVIEHVIRGEEGKEKRVRMVFRGHPDPAAQAAEMRAMAAAHLIDQDKMMAELRKGLAEADRALGEMPRVIAQVQAASGEAQRVIVMNNCNGEPTETVTDKDGRTTILFCQSRVIASARQGLEEARAEIAADKDIPEETRRQILKELDRSIARWKEKEG